MRRHADAVLAALALNELRAGAKPLRLGDAHALMTGAVDVLGKDWQRSDLREGVTRLLSIRHARLASFTDFREVAAEVLASGAGGLYALAEDGDAYVPVHAEEPEALTKRLLDAARPSRPRRRARVTELPARLAATVRGGSDGGGSRITVTLPAGFEFAPETAVTLRPCARGGALRVPISELLALARELDQARGPFGKQYEPILRKLFGELRTVDRKAVEQLEVDPGLLELLVAPTGSGKSALLVVLAVLLASRGQTFAIVVPDKRTTLELAREIEVAADAVGRTVDAVPLMSANAVWGEAEGAIASPRPFDPDGMWTFSRLGYSCLLSDGAAETIPPGREPCDSLHDVDRGGRGQAVDCPVRGRCAKFSSHREACEADVIVTNHAALLTGKVRALVEVGGEQRYDVSIAELIARRADLIVIDEVDQLQESALDSASNGLPLADSSVEHLLGRLARELDAAGAGPEDVDPRWEGMFRKILSRVRWLSDQYRLLHSSGLLDGADGRLHLTTESDGKLASSLGLSDDAPRVLDELCRERACDDPEREALRRRIHAIVDQNDVGVTSEQAVARLEDALAAVVADGDECRWTARALTHRVFRSALAAGLSKLLQHLPAAQEALPSAAAVEDRLGFLRPLELMPFGPLGRIVYGFSVSPDTRRLSCSRFAGDPQRWVAHFGDVAARAFAGVERPVLGLSATSYLPDAPVTHVPGRVRYVLPDRDRDQVRVAALPLVDSAGALRRVSGSPVAVRAAAVRELGAALAREHVPRELAALAADPATADRARVLLTSSSYADAYALAHGAIAELGRDRVLLVWRDAADHDRAATPLLDRRELARFPDLDADVLIAPVSVVARGHNIVLPDGRSALGAIYACVRPLVPADDPGLLLGRVSAHAWRTLEEQGLPDDPSEAMRALYRHAWRRLHFLLRHQRPFAELPHELRRGLVIELLADLIQLIGRARRGDTPATLYLVDAAFHEGPAALPRLIADVIEHWRTSGVLEHVAETHAATLGAFCRYAGIELPAPAEREAANARIA